MRTEKLSPPVNFVMRFSVPRKSDLMVLHSPHQQAGHLIVAVGVQGPDAHGLVLLVDAAAAGAVPQGISTARAQQHIMQVWPVKLESALRIPREKMIWLQMDRLGRFSTLVATEPGATSPCSWTPAGGKSVSATESRRAVTALVPDLAEWMFDLLDLYLDHDASWSSSSSDIQQPVRRGRRPMQAGSCQAASSAMGLYNS